MYTVDLRLVWPPSPFGTKEALDQYGRVARMTPPRSDASLKATLNDSAFTAAYFSRAYPLGSPNHYAGI